MAKSTSLPSKANLRQALDSFKDNVLNKIPTTLRFDGGVVHLTAEGDHGLVGMVTDLKDDSFYRLTEEDIRDTAEEMGEEVKEGEMYLVKKGIESGLGNCWTDIVECAIQNVVDSRRES